MQALTLPDKAYLREFDRIDKSAKRLGYLLWRSSIRDDEYGLYVNEWDEIYTGNLLEISEFLRREFRSIMEG